LKTKKSNTEMANMYNINSLSYTPRENPEWFTRAAFGGRLIENGYVRIMTGVKGDELLSMIDLNNKVLQIDGQNCAWTPNQIVKLSEKRARVKTYKINLEQCIDTLELKRTQHMLKAGAHNDSLPAELEEATLHILSIELSNEIEEMIVGGDETANPNHFDGIEKTLLASDQATKRAGYPLDRDNVLEVVEEVYNAFPENVLQAENGGNLYIMGSYRTRGLIRAALANHINTTVAPAWTADDSDKVNPRLYYLGAEFIAVKGISDNTLIGYASNNAFLLTDLEGDLDQIELGQFPKPNDSNVWIKGRMRLGFVMPFEDEAVIWSEKIDSDQNAETRDDYLGVTPNSLVFAAKGGQKTFLVITKEEVEPTVTASSGGSPAKTVGAGASNPTVSGFTVTKSEENYIDGLRVTLFTVEASSNEGSRDARVGEVKIKLPNGNRTATVTLNQRNEDVESEENVEPDGITVMP